MRARPLLPITASLTLAIPALLAQDPPTPPGGFPIRLDADLPVTYADGYRTLMDVRLPDAVQPGADGWPCVLVIHGGSGSRKVGWVQTDAELLAAAGYLTVAYDTGNEGATVRLNPGVSRSEPERLTDIAEILALAELRYGVRLDERRIAVTGRSGGGRHALMAASFSGLALLAPRSVARMPEIAAIHSDIQVLDAIADTLPQGAMFETSWALRALQQEGPTGPTLTRMRNGDYAGLAAMLRAEPLTDLMPRLAQSRVPMFVSYAYDDNQHFVNVNADAFARLPAGVPRRYLQSTGGHASVENRIETALRRDHVRRWFDRFLKGLPTQVDREPFAELAVLPAVPAEYLDPDAAWSHRQSDVWPLAPTTRLFPRGDRSLRADPPTVDEIDAPIRHRVAPGYDLLQFVRDDARPNRVTASIPLVTQGWTGPLYPGGWEFLGRSVAEFDVVATAPDFQVHVALLDVAPDGQERFITSGVTAVRGGPIAVRQRVRVELGDVAYVGAPDHRFRVSVENVNLRRQPGNVHFHVVPDFADVDFVVQIDPTFPARIDLPLRTVAAALTPRFAQLPATLGLRHQLAIDATGRRAGAPYLVLMGGSGSVPGLTLDGLRVPLTYDSLTEATVALLGTAFVPGFVGVLDASGRASARLDLPPAIAPILLGRRLTFAAVGLEASGAPFTTAPADVVVVP